MRHHGRKGYLVFKDPYGRYVKVKGQNRNFIPKGWKQMVAKMFIKDGELTEATHAIVEITSKKHAEWFSSIHNINIGYIFGDIDGKRKKNIF